MKWEEVVTQVAAAVPVWDAWGVDDGRPIAALRAAQIYAVAPTYEHHTALEAALARARLAWLNALAAESATWQAGQPPGAVIGAQDAAFAILSLGTALLTTGADRAAHMRNAASYAALAARHLPLL